MWRQYDKEVSVDFVIDNVFCSSYITLEIKIIQEKIIMENQFGGRYDIGIINAIPNILKEKGQEQQQPIFQQQPEEHDTASRFADLFARYAMAGIGDPKDHVLSTIKRTWDGLSPEQRKNLISLYYKSSVYPKAKAVREILNNNPELKQTIMSEVNENRKNNPVRESRIVMRNTLFGGALGTLVPLSLLAIKKIKRTPIFVASAIGGMIGIGLGNTIGTVKALSYAKAHPISEVTIAKKKGILDAGSSK